MSQETQTPRSSTASSSARKKRRRKSSQSESKRNTGSNTSILPQSPTRTPSSPVDITPNANALSANPHLDSQCSNKENVSGQNTPQVSSNSTPLECFSGNAVSDVTTPSSGVNGWTEKVTRSTRKGNKARTKLISKFNTSPGDDSNVLEDSKCLNTNSLNGIVNHINDKKSCRNVIQEVNGSVPLAKSALPKRPWTQASPRYMWG